VRGRGLPPNRFAYSNLRVISADGTFLSIFHTLEYERSLQGPAYCEATRIQKYTRQYVALLSSADSAKSSELNFSVAKIFASGGEIREWETGFRL
jgi:hypothetical protein